MASTNKLPNTFLNQWLDTDKPEMEDFNRDNRIIDGLAGHLQNIPKIGPDSFWYVWDTDAGEYVSTGQKARGEIGPRGPQGERGETGLQGAVGAQGLQGEQGSTGMTGPIGTQGEKGDKGDTGSGFQLLGRYETVAELIDAHPTGMPGEAYAVGTAIENEVYVWAENAWTSIGKLQGPQGVKGDAGEKGDPGTQGERGETGPQGAAGAQGVAGDKGDAGDTGAVGPIGLQGAPAKVNGILPDESGEIVLTAASVGADPIGSAATVQATLDAAKADKSTSYTLTLTAAGWAGTPFAQTLSIPAGTTTSLNELYEGVGITTAQLEALRAADLADGGQAAGMATYTVRGEKPTIDIPVLIVVRGDL